MLQESTESIWTVISIKQVVLIVWHIFQLQHDCFSFLFYVGKWIAREWNRITSLKMENWLRVWPQDKCNSLHNHNTFGLCSFPDTLSYQNHYHCLVSLLQHMCKDTFCWSYIRVHWPVQIFPILCALYTVIWKNNADTKQLESRYCWWYGQESWARLFTDQEF